MKENLSNMTNSELKAYIRIHRNDELACHEAINLLMSRQTENTIKYPYNLPTEDMEAIFQQKLK